MADTNIKIKLSADGKQVHDEIKLIDRELKNLGNTNILGEESASSPVSSSQSSKSSNDSIQRSRDRLNSLLYKEVMMTRRELGNLIKNTGTLNQELRSTTSGFGSAIDKLIDVIRHFQNTPTSPTSSTSSERTSPRRPPTDSQSNNRQPRQRSNEESAYQNAVRKSSTILMSMFGKFSQFAELDYRRQLDARRTYGAVNYDNDYSRLAIEATERGKNLGYDYHDVLAATRANQSIGGYYSRIKSDADIRALLEVSRANELDVNRTASVSGEMVATGLIKPGEQRKFANMLSEAVNERNMRGRQSEELSVLNSINEHIASYNTTVTEGTFSSVSNLYNAIAQQNLNMRGQRGGNLAMQMADIANSGNQALDIYAGLGTTYTGLSGRLDLRRLAASDPQQYYTQALAGMERSMGEKSAETVLKDMMVQNGMSIQKADAMYDAIKSGHKYDTKMLDAEGQQSGANSTEDKLATYSESQVSRLNEINISIRELEAELGQNMNALKAEMFDIWKGLPEDLQTSSMLAGIMVGGKLLSSLVSLVSNIPGAIAAGATFIASGVMSGLSKLIGGIGGVFGEVLSKGVKFLGKGAKLVGGVGTALTALDVADETSQTVQSISQGEGRETAKHASNLGVYGLAAMVGGGIGSAFGGVGAIPGVGIGLTAAGIANAFGLGDELGEFIADKMGMEQSSDWKPKSIWDIVTGSKTEAAALYPEETPLPPEVKQDFSFDAADFDAMIKQEADKYKRSNADKETLKKEAYERYGITDPVVKTEDTRPTTGSLKKTEVESRDTLNRKTQLENIRAIEENTKALKDSSKRSVSSEGKTADEIVAQALKDLKEKDEGALIQVVKKLTDKDTPKPKFSPSAQQSSTQYSFSAASSANKPKSKLAAALNGDIFGDTNSKYLYNQADYEGTPYAYGSMARSGCTPTAIAMMASMVHGKEITPDQVAPGYFGIDAGLQNWVGNTSYYMNSNSDQQAEAYKSLQQGKPVLIYYYDAAQNSSGNNPYTSNQHAMVLTGLNKDGTVNINDPNGGQQHTDSWENLMSFSNDLGVYNGEMPKSHGHGLKNVPYDRYPAYLHKGERVLTKLEAEELRDLPGISVPKELHIDEDNDSITDIKFKRGIQEEYKKNTAITQSSLFFKAPEMSTESDNLSVKPDNLLGESKTSAQQKLLNRRLDQVQQQIKKQENTAVKPIERYSYQPKQPTDTSAIDKATVYAGQAMGRALTADNKAETALNWVRNLAQQKEFKDIAGIDIPEYNRIKHKNGEDPGDSIAVARAKYLSQLELSSSTAVTSSITGSADKSDNISYHKKIQLSGNSPKGLQSTFSILTAGSSILGLLSKLGIVKGPAGAKLAGIGSNLGKLGTAAGILGSVFAGKQGIGVENRNENRNSTIGMIGTLINSITGKSNKNPIGHLLNGIFGISSQNDLMTATVGGGIAPNGGVIKDTKQVSSKESKLNMLERTAKPDEEGTPLEIPKSEQGGIIGWYKNKVLGTIRDRIPKTEPKEKPASLASKILETDKTVRENNEPEKPQEIAKTEKPVKIDPIFMDQVVSDAARHGIAPNGGIVKDTKQVSSKESKLNMLERTAKPGDQEEGKELKNPFEGLGNIGRILSGISGGIGLLSKLGIIKDDKLSGLGGNLGKLGTAAKILGSVFSGGQGIGEEDRDENKNSVGGLLGSVLEGITGSKSDNPLGFIGQALGGLFGIGKKKRVPKDKVDFSKRSALDKLDATAVNTEEGTPLEIPENHEKTNTVWLDKNIFNSESPASTILNAIQGKPSPAASSSGEFGSGGTMSGKLDLNLNFTGLDGLTPENQDKVVYTMTQQMNTQQMSDGILKWLETGHEFRPRW